MFYIKTNDDNSDDKKYYVTIGVTSDTLQFEGTIPMHYDILHAFCLHSTSNITF